MVGERLTRMLGRGGGGHQHDPRIHEKTYDRWDFLLETAPEAQGCVHEAHPDIRF